MNADDLRVPSFRPSVESADAISVPGRDEVAPPPALSRPADAATLSERVAASTRAGGLREIPKGFDDGNGDWQVVNADNPFLCLYLDHRQRVTPELVQTNAATLTAFWAAKVNAMNQGADRGRIIRKFAAGDERRLLGYADRVRAAAESLASEVAIAKAAADLEASRVQAGRSAISRSLAIAMLDGRFVPAEAAGVTHDAVAAGLTEEEATSWIAEELRAAGFRPRGNPPDGEMAATPLFSVTWTTDEPEPPPPPLETDGSVVAPAGPALGPQTVRRTWGRPLWMIVAGIMLGVVAVPLIHTFKSPSVPPVAADVPQIDTGRATAKEPVSEAEVPDARPAALASRKPPVPRQPRVRTPVESNASPATGQDPPGAARTPEVIGPQRPSTSANLASAADLGAGTSAAQVPPAVPKTPPSTVKPTDAARPAGPTGAGPPRPDPALPATEPAPDSGPMQGEWRYDGPGVVQNQELIVPNLPKGRLILTVDEKAWAYRLEPVGDGQRLVLVSKKKGVQKKCTVKWRLDPGGLQ